MTTPIVFSVLSLSVSVLSFFFFRWYIRRKTAVTQMLADYREEVGRLIAEIDVATDRDSILVEERIKILRQLLEDTDKRIAVYIREVQRSRDGEAMYTSLGRGIRAALDTRPPPQEQPAVFTGEMAPSHGTAPREAPEPTTENESAPSNKAPSGKKRGTKAKPSEEAVEQEKADASSEKSKLKVQVAKMSAQGVPPQEIASKLGISIAEVDLALSLLHRPAG